MISITSVRSSVIEKLKNSSALSGFEITREFSQKGRSALHQPVITIGIDSIEIVPAGLGGYFGKDKLNNYEGSWANITLKCDCYADISNKTHDHQEVFELLAQELFNTGLGITKVSSLPIVVTNGAFSARLSLKAKLQTLVATARPAHYVNDFILKRSDTD